MAFAWVSVYRLARVRHELILATRPVPLPCPQSVLRGRWVAGDRRRIAIRYIDVSG